MSVHRNKVDLVLIEDSMDDARLIIRALNKGSQLHIIHLLDGEQGLEYFFGNGHFEGKTLEHRPRLILLDLMMPRVTGLEVLQKLKSDDRTRSIPVVVLTSSRQDPDITNAYDLGASSYIVKCIDAAQFESTILKLQQYWFPAEGPQ